MQLEKREFYIQQVFSFLKAISQYTGAVANESYYQAALEEWRQKPSFRNKMFYVLLNLKTQKVTWSKYAFQTVGFQDVDFEKGIRPPNGITLRDCLTMIKPNYLPMNVAFAKSPYQIAAKYPSVRQVLATLNPELILQFPIQLRDGKYYWTTQTGIPFELDKNNNIISNINIYHIETEYYDQRIPKPMVTVKGGRERNEKVEAFLQQQLSENFFRELLDFKPIVVKLVQAYNQHQNLTIEQAAIHLNTSKENIKTYNKTIKRAINQYFSEDINPFPTARAAALYLGRLLGDYLVLK
ncbi:MAG: hypothetical protein AAF849_07565 [Bacteroidota bacterium]